MRRPSGSRARLKWLATASCQPNRAVSRNAAARSIRACRSPMEGPVTRAITCPRRSPCRESQDRGNRTAGEGVPMRQPNILMIMADQLSALALPAYGHPIVRTPHLDRLAAQGVVFENAYCNFPLCAPSRASLMSGQLASRIGVYDNAAEFPASVPTLAHGLR